MLVDRAANRSASQLRSFIMTLIGCSATCTLRRLKQAALAIVWVAASARAANATAFAYIPNGNDDTISVIDTSTNTVRATIPASRPFGVAVNGTGTRVFVTAAGSVLVIDTAENAVIAAIPTASYGGGGIVLDDSGTRAYVGNGGDPGVVSVIDTGTNTIVGTLTAGRQPGGIAISGDGTQLYLGNTFDDIEQHHCFAFRDMCPLTVSVLDIASNTVTATIANVGANLHQIVVTPDGTRAYVTTKTQREMDQVGLAVIDTATNTVIAKIPIQGGTFAVAVNNTGSAVYAVGATDVFVVDAASNEVVATIPVGGGAHSGIAVTPSGTRVYVTNLGFNSAEPGTVSAIDTETNSVVATITVGRGPFPFGNFIGPEIAPTPTITATPTPTPTGGAAPATGGGSCSLGSQNTEGGCALALVFPPVVLLWLGRWLHRR
jgi:YVTN family beta-propeller protein